MKNIKIYLSFPVLLILCLPLLALNCDKNVDPPSKETLLSKDWKISQVLIDNVPDQATNYSGYRITFNTNGDYIFTETPGTVSQGKWEFDSNKQNLIFDRNTLKQQNVRVIVLETDKLELEFIVPATYKTPQQLIVYKLVP